MAPDEPPLEFPPSCRPETVTLYNFWRAKCGTRRMPRRADIEPWEIPPRLLPCISLVDVVKDERRYVYRLVGTADVQVRGHDPTGRSVIDGFFGPDADNALSCYDTVVKTRAPLLDPEPFLATNGRYATEETIFLPLSDDGTHVNKILVFFAFKDVLDPTAPVQLDL
jgi:hypothetical protein